MENQAKIYLDYAASTPLDSAVFEVVKPWLTERFGNSSSLHDFGRQASVAVETAREVFALALNCAPSEIVFTASATEANNTVLKGLLRTDEVRKKHIIISAIEHNSVYRTARYLEQTGWALTLAPVDKHGVVDLFALQEAIRPDTLLVSLMLVNNETGVIQPVKEAAAICREKELLLHCDAAQGLGKMPLDLRDMGVDFLTGSAHKIYGPPGAGLLYIKKGRNLAPLLHGGGHEAGRRASTVNVPAVVGFARAMELYGKMNVEEQRRLANFKRKILRFVAEKIPQTRINGDVQRSLPHILNIAFKNLDAELLAMALDSKGIAVSTGSACGSGSLKTSRVLRACHVPAAWLKGAIRISMGRFTTEEEINIFTKVLKESVEQVRKIS